jgi:hypothetical protein
MLYAVITPYGSAALRLSISYKVRGLADDGARDLAVLQSASLWLFTAAAAAAAAARSWLATSCSRTDTAHVCCCAALQACGERAWLDRQLRHTDGVIAPGAR